MEGPGGGQARRTVALAQLLQRTPSMLRYTIPCPLCSCLLSGTACPSVGLTPERRSDRELRLTRSARQARHMAMLTGIGRRSSGLAADPPPPLIRAVSPTNDQADCEVYLEERSAHRHCPRAAVT
eukprot:scaffold1223_cov380-Prasinococcus_capsulatus_cf.AAC.4